MAEVAKYIGGSTTRRMLQRDWAAAGIPDQPTVEWSKRNGYQVARDQFTDEAWDMLGRDSGIVIVDADATPAQVHEAHVSAAVARMQMRAAELATEDTDEPSTDESESSDEV
jgi:hypothetical protein